MNSDSDSRSLADTAVLEVGCQQNPPLTGSYQPARLSREVELIRPVFNRSWPENLLEQAD